MTTADLARVLGVGSTPVAASSAFPDIVPPDVPNWNMGFERYLQPNTDPNMKTAAPESATDPSRITKPAWVRPPGVQTIAGPQQMPGVGPLPGQVFLNPEIAPKVPDGSPRPLAPGEYIKNPDGAWSSEITGTIEQGQHPQLNGGKATIVPTLWIVKGVPTRVDEDTAAAYAVQSGLPFRSFDSNEAAETFSQQREDIWQTMGPEDAGKVPALWAAPEGK